MNRIKLTILQNFDHDVCWNSLFAAGLWEDFHAGGFAGEDWYFSLFESTTSGSFGFVKGFFYGVFGGI